MNALGLALLVLLVAIAGLFVYAARLPREFRVSRSTRISARAERIFPLIDDLRAFNRWNPFASQVSAAQITYTGAERGPGAAFEWDAPGRAGAGRIEITHSSAPQSVRMALAFRRPMQANNVADFTLQPAGEETDVSWTMTGPWPLVQRAMSVVFDMDKLIGGEFAKGLAELKRLAESS